MIVINNWGETLDYIVYNSGGGSNLYQGKININETKTFALQPVPAGNYYGLNLNSENIPGLSFAANNLNANDTIEISRKINS